MKKLGKKDIRIYKTRPEDAEDIMELGFRSWLATYPNRKYKITIADIRYQYRNRHKKEDIERQQEKIINPPNGHHKFVAKEGKKIIGMCNVIVEKDHNQLKSIYLLPEYFGKGIGKMLWNHAKKYLDPKKRRSYMLPYIIREP